ncbi:hypothetical protein L1987_12738 [Smallanthus sonchifolius]|uniref:Uncharacterized protein n=1 Tax=Smallanthus sonchifolius TaxID=185202 RepID=A0ACB9JEY8_9ASTR|nr:hypothetical protein L1987_12738 [Smallanthus sonchifolius]
MFCPKRLNNDKDKTVNSKAYNRRATFSRWPWTWALFFQLNSPLGEEDIIAGSRRNHIHIQTSIISSRSDPEAVIGSIDLICDFIIYLLNFNPK